MTLQHSLVAVVMSTVFLCPAAFSSQTGGVSPDEAISVHLSIASGLAGGDIFIADSIVGLASRRSPSVDFIHATTTAVWSGEGGGKPLPGELLIALAEDRKRDAADTRKRPRHLSQIFREEETNHHPLELEIEQEKGEKKEKSKDAKEKAEAGKDDVKKDDAKKDDIKKDDFKKVKKDFGDKNQDGDDHGKTPKKDATLDRKESRRFKKEESPDKDDKRKLKEKERRKWARAG